MLLIGEQPARPSRRPCRGRAPCATAAAASHDASCPWIVCGTLKLHSVFQRPVLDDVLHGAGHSLLRTCRGSACTHSCAALHAGHCVVVELHDDDLGAVGRNPEIHARLLRPGVRRSSARMSAPTARRLRAACAAVCPSLREERDDRRGARDEQQRPPPGRSGRADRRAQVAEQPRRAAGSSALTSLQPGRHEDADDADVRAHAQHAARLQDDERRVPR